jgi:6,7-dimethyl-8-ribityllumazine synthase
MLGCFPMDESNGSWNSEIVNALVKGALETMVQKHGVLEQNIHIESVPGSWELPISVSRYNHFDSVANRRLIAGSQVQSTVGSSDLLGSGDVSMSMPEPSGSPKTSPFDAVIAIGVLIKGETMHFEYIADSVSKGLMRVGLDTGVPVIFGLLTVLSEKQAMARAGMIDGEMHNHAVDWASAAVELGSKGKNWAQGKLS